MGTKALKFAVTLFALTAVGLPFHAARAEVVLKAVSAFPKSNPLTKSFLKFIDLVNAKAGGAVRVDYIGGPEVMKPRSQPIGLRNGVFDLLYGPPAYYLGIFPEGDVMDGMKTPPESRLVHGFKMIDRAARKKLGATFLGRFNFGIGLHVFLRAKPRIDANGNVDLKGLKIRSSGSYLDFLRALGATPVSMRGSEIYTALERGVVDGAASSIDTVYTDGLYKFLKYRIDPSFSNGVIILIANAKKFDSLPSGAQEVLRSTAISWEKTSMDEMKASERDIAAKLAKLGQKTVTLKNDAAKRYVAAYQDGIWKRVKKNVVDLNLKKAEAAFR